MVSPQTYTGPTSATMKLHLLSHVVPCVQNWGPVWAYSCFQFESQNHSLKKLFHGSRNTSSTVCHDVNSCLLWMEFNLENLECVYILYPSIYCMAGNFRGGGTMCMDYLLHESYLPSGKLVKAYYCVVILYISP